MFIYKRFLFVYETDLMGIVHHSNYLRFCEEARIEWCHRFINYKALESELGHKDQHVFDLTVVSTQVEHKKPLVYRDEFKIEMTAQIKGALLHFSYSIKNGNDETCALAFTSHCRVLANFKPARLPAHILKAVKDSQNALSDEFMP